MSKQADFGNDLAALNDNVTAAVDDVLQALQQKRSTKQRVSNPTIEASPADSTPSTTPDAATKPEQPAASSPPNDLPRRQRLASRSKLAVTVEEDEPLENVTTRLRRSTNALLTEAALRQRLKKVAPDSRQAIVEAALHDWFRKHGYRGGGDANEN
jgi:hypothetical protein